MKSRQLIVFWPQFFWPQPNIVFSSRKTKYEFSALSSCKGGQIVAGRYIISAFIKIS